MTVSDLVMCVVTGGGGGRGGHATHTEFPKQLRLPALIFIWYVPVCPELHQNSHQMKTANNFTFV